MTVHGPANADAFRVKVGRYGERWYHDPLPACALAPATDDAWPSATTVKNAWPKFLTAWAATEAATYAVKERAAWEHLEPEVAVSVIAKAHERSRDAAGGRGTLIHSTLEAMATGYKPDPVADHEIAAWVPAMESLIADVAPEWILSEAVVISRRLGVAGTLDAVWRIGGADYLVDFKSRKAGRVGDAYDDEGVQLGLYAWGEYVIADRGGEAVRLRLPNLAGGLIITIAPEGYRMHPVNLDAARKGAHVLRQFWQVQADRDIVGKPVHLRNVDNSAGALRLERRAWLIGFLQYLGQADALEAVRAHWPRGVPTFKEQQEHTDEQLDAIAAVVIAVAAEFGLAFFDSDPASRRPERPHDLDLVRLEQLKTEFDDDDIFERVVAYVGGEPGTKTTVDKVAALLDDVEAGRRTVALADDGALVLT